MLGASSLSLLSPCHCHLPRPRIKATGIQATGLTTGMSGKKAAILGASSLLLKVQNMTGLLLLPRTHPVFSTHY